MKQLIVAILLALVSAPSFAEQCAYDKQGTCLYYQHPQVNAAIDEEYVRCKEDGDMDVCVDQIQFRLLHDLYHKVDQMEGRVSVPDSAQ